MKLYLESSSEVDHVSNMVRSSVELGEILQNFNETGKEMCPLEAAALTLTMKQINVGTEPMLASESKTVFSKYFPVLAHEALKDGIREAWDKFLAFIKNINKRFLDALSNLVNRVRKFFKKKAGDKNSNFEREGEQTEEPEDKSEGFKLPKTYKMSSCYIDMGGEANAESLISRLVYSRKLIGTAEVLVAQHGGLAASFFEAAEKFTDNTQWEDFVGQRTQHVLDILMENLNATVESGRAIVKISETAQIIMLLTDNAASFPHLLLDKEKQVDLTLPNDPKKFGREISRLAKALLDPIMRSINESRKILAEREYNELAKVKDDTVRQRMMTLGTLVTRRSLFNKDILGLVTTTQDIADGIAADIAEVTNGSY